MFECILVFCVPVAVELVILKRHLTNAGLVRGCKYMVSLCIACVTNGAAAMDSLEKNVAELVARNTLVVTNKFGPSFVYFDPSGTVFQRGGDGVIGVLPETVRVRR